MNVYFFFQHEMIQFHLASYIMENYMVVDSWE